MAVGLNKKSNIETEEIVEPFAEPLPLPSDDTQYFLSYPNKCPASKLLESKPERFYELVNGQSSTATIYPNALIAGDNFQALKSLIPDMAGKVNLIYLDPPYCTGFEFGSRTFQHAYSDAMSPVSYIEFMRRRFILMHELLANDGSIYVHIGHHMLCQLKLVLDEVFGVDSFRNIIIRKKCSSKNYTRKQYPNLNDYILFYTKSKNWVWNRPGRQPSPDWIKREYPKEDSRGRYKLVPVHAPGTRNGSTGSTWRDKLPPPGKHWQFTPDKLEEMDKNGEIHWSKNMNPRRKVYLPADKEIPYTDYWDAFRDAHHQSVKITGYPTEKNLDMLKMVIEASSNPGDIVLDPFCGSGTTLHAASDLNRNWIGIDQSVTALNATINRLQNGLLAMGDYVTDNSSQKSLDFPNVSESRFGSKAFRIYSTESTVRSNPWLVSYFSDIHERH